MRPPIIVIGAPRSGTNMLRDALCGIPGLATWPCDEINYVWRHGNRGHPTDEFPPDFARPEVRRYIRRAFERIARRTGAERVVEKTCANSLRVAFVDRVVPEAHFVFLLRDGRTAAASAMRRWRGRAELGYILRKARYVPLSDVPYYALRFLRGGMVRLWGSGGQAGWWGPRFSGGEELLDEASLAEVCAVQWRRCVEAASQDLEALGADRVTTVRYETFVGEPAAELSRILEACGVEASPDDVGAAVRHVTPRAPADPSPAARDVIERVTRPALARLGYA